MLVLPTTHSDYRIDDSTGKPMMVINYNQTKYGFDVVVHIMYFEIADIINIAGINALVLYEQIIQVLQ